MAVICKPTVRFKGFNYSLLTILDTLVWLDAHKVTGQPEDLVVTSANDGTHKANSKHYSNEALDLRTKTFNGQPSKAAFMSALKKELGAAFTVLYECEGTPNEHLHVQAARKK